MIRVFQGIAANTPLWVWPLFLGLVIIGLISTRTRTTPIILYAILPFLGFMSIGSIGGLPYQTLGWSVFGIFYATGLWIGFRLQTRWIIARMGAQMRVKGERVTLTVLVIIFIANFADGIIGAILPDLRIETAYTVVFAALIGAISGSFLGRAICVFRTKPSQDSAA